MSTSFPSFSLHQMEVGCRLCKCVRVYLCMGWRGVGGVEVWVTNKLLVSESMGKLLYNHYNGLWIYKIILGCTNISMCVYVTLHVWRYINSSTGWRFSSHRVWNVDANNHTTFANRKIWWFSSHCVWNVHANNHTTFANIKICTFSSHCGWNVDANNHTTFANRKICTFSSHCVWNLDLYNIARLNTLGIICCIM